jgi:hypothetical protein
LKLNVAWPDDISDESIRSPVTEEELRTKYKMDHFVINLLEGEKHVLRYLCKECKLHLIPLALQRSREEEIVNTDAFQKFCVGKTYYNVKKSDYGKRSKQTSTSPIRDAELIGDSGKHIWLK